MLPLFEDGKLAQHVCMLSWSNSVIPWVIILQAPLFMGFLRQEYWSGLPCLPPGDLPQPGIKLMSPALQVESLLLLEVAQVKG